MNDYPKHISPNVLCMNEIRIHLDRRQNIEYIKKSNDLFSINLEMRDISKRNSDLHSNLINILNIGTVHTVCAG